MNHTKHSINFHADSNRVEIAENKILLAIKKFWQFSLFYGDYLGSLHSHKKL